MTENPYQSPIDTSAESPESAVDARGMHPLGKIVLGPILGVMFGGFFGALGAGILGLIGGLAQLSQPSNDLHLPSDVPTLVIAGALFGSFFGVMSGGAVGLILGIIACFAEATFRLGFLCISAVLCGAVGIVVGLLGGNMIGMGQFSMVFVWYGIGALCGGLAGTGGGTLLGKTLARVFWGLGVNDVSDVSENA